MNIGTEDQRRDAFNGLLIGVRGWSPLFARLPVQPIMYQSSRDKCPEIWRLRVDR